MKKNGNSNINLSVLAIAILLLISTPMLQLVNAQDYPREQTFITTRLHTADPFKAPDNFNILNIAAEWPGETGVIIQNEALFYWIPSNGSIIPWLARGYEVGAGGSSLKIFLRKDVHWNDGESFNAEDVVFSLEMLKDNPLLMNAELANRTIERVTALDDYTVLIDLKIPDIRYYLHFTTLVCWAKYQIVPEHVYSTADDIATFTNPDAVFTGPYKIVSSDEFTYIWERDENWWAIKAKGVYPQPKYFIVQQIGTKEKHVMALENNQIDSASMQVEFLTALEAHERNPHIFAYLYPATFVANFYINKYLYPTNILEVRKAMSYAIDREKLVFLGGGAEKGTHVRGTYIAPLPGLQEFSDPVMEAKYNATVYDPVMANAILDNLGFLPGPDGIRVTPNGTRLSFDFSGFTPIEAATEAYIDMFEDVGIELTFQAATYDTQRHRCDGMDFQVISCWGFYMTTTPYELYKDYVCEYADTPWGPEGVMSVNRIRFCNPEFDAIIEQLGSIQDYLPDGTVNPQAAVLYHRLEELLLQEYIAIPTTSTLEHSTHNDYWWGNWPTLSGATYFGHAQTHWSNFMFVLLNLESTVTGRVNPPVEKTEIEVRLDTLEDTLESEIGSLSNSLSSINNTVYMSAGIGIIAAIIAAAAFMRTRRTEA